MDKKKINQDSTSSMKNINVGTMGDSSQDSTQRSQQIINQEYQGNYLQLHHNKIFNDIVNEDKYKDIHNELCDCDISQPIRERYIRKYDKHQKKQRRLYLENSITICNNDTIRQQDVQNTIKATTASSCTEQSIKCTNSECRNDECKDIVEASYPPMQVHYRPEYKLFCQLDYLYDGPQVCICVVRINVCVFFIY